MMPYKDKVLQREAVKEAVRRHRQGITAQGTDPKVLHLAEALIDPIKRAKLVKISNALNKNITGLDGRPLNLGTQVRYGIEGFTFADISELL